MRNRFYLCKTPLILTIAPPQVQAGMTIQTSTRKSESGDISPPLKFVLDFKVRWNKFSDSDLVDLSW
ncbi:MAG: hypothetical protein ABF379_11470 [Akkermansiaceae bacterium]